MKLRRLFAAVAATAVAASAMAVTASALDATSGVDGFAAICYADGTWASQYWINTDEKVSVASDVVVTGAGTYTVTIDAKTLITDEDTGDETIEDGATDLAFAAIEIEQGEILFPGMIITIDSVVVDGNTLALNGTPYTSSDDQQTTRVNLYNEWVPAPPDDARTIGGLAADATPTALDRAIGAWKKMEVTFTITLPESDEAPAVVDTAAPSAGSVDAATDSSKGSPDTGIADVAAVAGLALVAAGAIVVSKKRK